MNRRMRQSLALSVLLASTLTALAIHGAIQPPSALLRWLGALGVALVGCLAVALAYRASRRLHELEEQTAGLSALEEAARKIQSELELTPLLQAITDQSRRLLNATYGALSISNSEGAIEKFITSGLTPEARRKIGALPSGRGLLASSLMGKSLRVPRIHQDPRSVGFPKHHPPMTSLLAVPIPTKSSVVANLYVTDKTGGGEFSEADLRSLGRFAASAALAIDTATLLYQKQTLAVAEERVRISREMHDGIAQILGYVNNKAQAAQAYLERGDPAQAGHQLEQLVGAGHELSADVREGIAALRTEIVPNQPLSASLKGYLQGWTDRSNVPVEVQLSDEPNLPADVALQLVRIAQESLTNIRRHAKARHVVLKVRGEPARLTVSIEDDGLGFDPASLPEKGHYGLSVMRERAEAVGAVFEVRSKPGEGTRIRLQLPFEGRGEGRQLRVTEGPGKEQEPRNESPHR